MAIPGKLGMWRVEEWKGPAFDHYTQEGAAGGTPSPRKESDARTNAPPCQASLDHHGLNAFDRCESEDAQIAGP